MFDKGLIERLQGVLKDDFVRLSYTEGIKFWKRPLLKATRSSSRYIGVSTWLLSMNVSWLKSISNVR